MAKTLRRALSSAVAIAVAGLVALALLAPATAQAAEGNLQSPTTWEDLAGARVGLLTGAPFEEPIRQHVPDVGDILYFTTMPDMLVAMRSGKIDALLNNNAVASFAASHNDGLVVFPEPLAETDMGIAFPKGSSWTAQFAEITDRLQADGTADALWEEWTGADDDAKGVPEQDWPGTNGTLTVAACESLEPVSYLAEGQMLGYDIETLLIAAKELDVHLEFVPLEFAEVLAYLQSGKADLGCGSIVISEERAQVMDFATTHANNIVLLVRGDSASLAAAGDGSASTAPAGSSSQAAAAQPGSTGGLRASFERTFVTENRWRLVLSGLAVTLVVTLCSALLGTALGFGTMLLRRRGSRVAEGFVRAFEGLMGRLPIVVVLMVFYYVIFGAIDIPGVVVAVLVFSLAFGASAGAIMWNAVKAVDVGQTEASLALGFSDQSTFFGVVLPQAARSFLPLLSGQLVSLAKDTSVVGYIAVQDLTRAGDLIRSRTMEAFFPLLSTAVIYFALCCLLASAMGAVIRHLDLERRPRAIKGVEL